MLKIISTFAALAVVSAVALPTISQAEEINSVTVSYADLNLASSAGQLILQRRVDEAARTVCVFEDSRELALRSATNACRGDALARARPAYEAAIADARHGFVTVGAGAAVIVSSR